MQTWSEIGSRVSGAARVVQSMIDKGGMHEPSPKAPGHVGAELEICFVGKDSYRPLLVGPKFVDDMHGRRTSKEVVAWNAELNPDPVELNDGVWSHLRQEFRRSISDAVNWARTNNAKVVACGTLPSASPSDTSDDCLTPGPRYLEMQESLAAYHQDGGNRPLQIGGEEGVALSGVRMGAEGLATSVQFHLPLSPSKLGRDLNFAHAILGPLVALAANSAFCFERLTHHVGRSDIFRSTIAPSRRRELNHFPTRWWSEDGSAFSDWCQHYFRAGKPAFVALPPDRMEDPVKLLRSYFGTSWPWIRVIVDREPMSHLRMEIRPFCAQASEYDSTGLAALFYGCMRFMQQSHLRAQSFVSAPQAWWNFRTALVWGMDPISDSHRQMCWRGVRRQPRSILYEMIGYAEEALLNDGHDVHDIEGALRPMKEIVFGGRANAAQWLRSNVRTLRKEGSGSGTTVGQVLSRTIAENIQANECKPICDWGNCAPLAC